MKKLEELINAPINKSIITEFLRMLEMTPASKRTKPVCINIQSNKECLKELKYPTYIDGDKEALKDLLECINAGVLRIDFRDKYEHRPLIKRKAMLYFNSDFELTCRKILSLEIDATPTNWFKAINASKLDSAIKEVLYSIKPIVIKDKSAQEIIEQIEKYVSLKRNGDLIRTASSWMFWGLSKILDNRPPIWCALKLTQQPIILNAFLPCVKTNKVLFIENEQTYVQCKRSLDDYILVFCSGFKGTASRIKYATEREIHIDERCMKESENLTTLQNALNGNNKISIFHWGDIDYSGIAIFLTLKKIYPHAKLWEEGYNKMIQIHHKSGHQPNQADKSGQREIKETGISYIDTVLLPTIKQHGMIDQECVLP